MTREVFVLLASLGGPSWLLSHVVPRPWTEASSALLQHSLGGPSSWEVEDRVFASDQTEFWSFGDDVALSGDRALVGAGGADVDGEIDRGAAYVFVRDGEQWVEEAELIASDGAAGHRFGRAVALDRDTAVVGAPFATVEAQLFRGAVYVFQRSGDTWNEVGKLVASDGAAQDRFGWSVGIQGDTIVVGAIHATIDGRDLQGASYVFQQQATLWIESDKLFDPEGQVADLFGSDAALQNETILIGAQSAAVDGDPNRGAAYAFTSVGTAWILEQKLLASDGQNPDQFGYAVALDGDRALIGAHLKTIGSNARQGAAYAFRRMGGSWVEEQRLTASNGHAESRFGLSAALNGTLALVGSRLDFPKNNPGRGVVYEYAYRDPAWYEIQWFVAPVGEGLDNFGESLSLTRERLLVSHVGSDSTQPPGGTAWIFRRPVLFADGFESGDTSAWTQAVP